ncbi:hypothetical protein NNO_0495 [Hydrogenimonas sp.]|nr:hypothetical protein NNO_0495 [Hydrogenimonas sp.]
MGCEVVLREGAWFIADSHYARYNTALYDFLSKLSPDDLPPQIFLMGDIFDLLFGYARNSIQPNRKMVDLLQQIARQCEVIYLEGNHDFGLEPLFGGVIRVVPRSGQPLMARFAEHSVALHHGDTLQGVGYEIYTALIRNTLVDRLLNMLDTATDGAVIGWLERYNRKKRPCYKIDDFEKLMRKRLDILKERYDFDIWIEGHFHQNVRFDYEHLSYFNLPAFACANTYTVIRLEGDSVEFEERRMT